jgi:arsenate reductase
VTVIIYGIRNCGTMKKARAWLDARGVAYTFHDYAASGVTRAQLARWAGEVGWERLCNAPARHSASCRRPKRAISPKRRRSM